MPRRGKNKNRRAGGIPPPPSPVNDDFIDFNSFELKENWEEYSPLDGDMENDKMTTYEACDPFLMKMFGPSEEDQKVFLLRDDGMDTVLFSRDTRFTEFMGILRSKNVSAYNEAIGELSEKTTTESEITRGDVADAFMKHFEGLKREAFAMNPDKFAARKIKEYYGDAAQIEVSQLLIDYYNKHGELPPDFVIIKTDVLETDDGSRVKGV